MRIEANAQAIILDPLIGQGKSTFRYAVSQRFENPSDETSKGLVVQTLTPDDGNLQTRMSWRMMRVGYQAVSLQRFAQAQRGKGIQGGLNERLLALANQEFNAVLSEIPLPILSMQGY